MTVFNPRKEANVFTNTARNLTGVKVKVKVNFTNYDVYVVSVCAYKSTSLNLYVSVHYYRDNCMLII